MKKTFKFLKEKYNSKEPLKTEWIVAIIIAFFMLISFIYIDLQSLTIWSTNVLDSIADGNILNYFKISALNIHGAPHGGISGVLFYLIPWAIWNIPIWIAQYFFHYEIMETPISIVWSKLFLVGALVLTLVYTYKIIMKLTNNKTKAKWGVFLSLTFLFTYIGVFFAGQSDILICLLGTIAIYKLLEKKSKWFYVLAGFAISIKYFFFVPFVILVLFLEKNLLKAFRNIIIGLIPSAVFVLLCYNLPMYTQNEKSDTVITMVKHMVGNSFPIIRSQQLSFLILGIIILAFIAYKTKAKDDSEKNKFIIYFVTASLCIFFAFGSHEFYRMTLLMPFIFIMFMISDRHLSYNIILETMASIGYMISIFCSSIYLFSSKYMANSLLAQIFNFSFKEEHSPYLVLQHSVSGYIGLIGSVAATIAFAALLLIVFINYPRSKLKLDVKEVQCGRYILWIRNLIIVPVIIYLLFRII